MLSSIVLKTTPTSYTVTGGTALPLTDILFNGEVHKFAPTADADLRTRRTYEFSHSDPKIAKGAPNGYSQERFKTLIKKPKILANLNSTVNTANLTFAVDVETTVAEKTALLDDIAQLCMDSNFRAAFTGANVA